jgi:hypothetical protein
MVMSESSYCDCDYDDWSSREFYSVTTVNRSRKEHRCDECRGTIFIGESYEKSAGKFDGDFIFHNECITCQEIRQWAVISMPCFCAYEWGTLLERVQEMVNDVAPKVDGFIEEWDTRRYQLKLRRMAVSSQLRRGS